MNLKILILVGLVLANLSCGFRSIPQSKNEVEATLAEITNQYKRRADLVPNLVSSVKGYTKHESETLVQVIEARAKATSVNIDPSRATPAQIKQFQDAQNGLSSALSRLLVSVEQYPNLKADTQFRDLQAQLEGTENRITVARNRYIESIKGFNNLVTVPPESWTNSLFYKFEKMPQWDVAESEKEQVQKAPEVKF